MIPKMKMNMTDESVSKDHATFKAYKYRKSLLSMSKLIWVYFGYSGLSNPWHNSPDPLWKYSLKTINGFIDFLDQESITLESYAILFFPLVHYSKYSKIGNIISNKGHRSWAKKLMRYVKDPELFDETADLLLKFFEYQVEYDGKAFIPASKVVQADLEITNSGKYCEAYHRLVDRIVQLKSNDIDPFVWLREKVRLVKSAFPDSPLQLRTILNVNGLEPSMKDLKSYTNDVWREIKDFLGLSQDCDISDGVIPKGWGSSSEDHSDLKDIVRIDKNGYYYFKDGSQRKGKFHYSKNTYFVIGCTPANFNEFKESWLDRRLISAMPTWEEYSMYGVYKGYWDYEGKSLTGRGRKIKWRSNGRKKEK